MIGVTIALSFGPAQVWASVVLLEREGSSSGSTGRSVASIDLFSHQPAAMAAGEPARAW
ncbi:MAG: hypothetical protein U0401_03090 [Anaerolineae bacterium]